MADLILSQKAVQKTILAKLLARENLHVEFRNIETPCFDVASRILQIPKLKETVSDVLYTSHIIHEVGHALYTDQKDWFDSVKLYPKRLVNIVEDARIEKLIKEEYPGTKTILYKFYEEMFQSGDLGFASLAEANKLWFIDRFNMHFKLGQSFGISFSKEEMVFVDKAYLMRSWTDVINLVSEIQEFIKMEKEKQKKNNPIIMQNEQKPGYGGMSNEGSDNDPTLPEDIESLTEEALDQLKKDMLEMLEEEIINIYAISSDWKDRIVSYKKVLSYTSNKWYKLEVLRQYQQFSKPYIEHMVQLFNLKKNAMEFKMMSFNKTGHLDLDRIHEYHITDDLFCRNVIQNKGQSHGLVIFFDWSSSMESNLKYSLYQLFFLTDFCRKTEIPFEVYTFTTGMRYIDNNAKKFPGSLYEWPYRLVNILSSKMIGNQYQKMQQLLLDINKYKKLEYFGMGGTPLNEVIMAAMEIVPLFKEQNRIDNVNICFVTDGDGHSINEFIGPDGITPIPYGVSKNVYFHDLKTHYVEKYQPGKLTVILLNMLRNRIKSNVIGFHIADPSNIQHSRLSSHAEKLKQEKIVTVSILEGYTHYHIIDNSLINIESTVRIMDRRIKFLLNQFIQLIT